jgi:hypothetical protein
MIRTHNRFYILAPDGQTPIQVDDVREWALMLEQRNRQVALTETGSHVVSTVFFGLDMSHGGDPLIWETMVFVDGHDVDRRPLQHVCRSGRRSPGDGREVPLVPALAAARRAGKRERQRCAGDTVCTTHQHGQRVRPVPH